MKPLIFTENEALEMMYRNTSYSFLTLANWAKDKTKEEIIDFLIEASDNLDTLLVVIKLRSDLLKN